MTERALYFWLDTETSGLLDDGPTVLEVAWMWTDNDLRQLTPLRQRLTCLPPAVSRWLRIWRWLTLHPIASPGSEWPPVDMGPTVMARHTQSSLAAEWTAGEKIHDVDELDADVHGDHMTALELLDPGGRQDIPVHLAGAGVAQFEARLLPMIGSNLTQMCHYRAGDTSVAAMVAGLPKLAEVDPDDGLELDLQPGVDPVRAATVEHRAATDVRIAYRAARELRAGVVRA